MSDFDKWVIRYLQRCGDADAIAAQLQLWCAYGNADYVSEMRRTFKVQDIMRLAVAIHREAV